MLGYLGVRSVAAPGKDPLSFSVALALARLRHAARSTAPAADDLDEHLATAVKDPYTRTRPKHARNWPRRTRRKPPGKPRLRRATKAKVKMAQEFHRESFVQQFTA